MTFIEFIKTKRNEENPVGDLINDILADKSFPIRSSTKEILEYLRFKTLMGDTEEAFEELVKQFKSYLQSSPKLEENENYLEKIFPLLRTERWHFLKENFTVNQVYLVGDFKDIYKVYCVDQKSKLALYFSLKYDSDLNDILIINEVNISIGNSTRKTSVNEAIQILETCPYDTPFKPVNKKFVELIEFLYKNKSIN